MNTVDSNQNPDFNNEKAMSRTKEKRDRFLVEIRKKKNQDAINQKRVKFSMGDSNDSSKPLIIPNQAGIPEIPQQSTQQTQSHIPSGVKFFCFFLP